MAQATAKASIPRAHKNRTVSDWVILILLIIGGLVMLFPFIVLLLNAFKTTADYNSSGPLSWPTHLQFDGLMKFWTRVNYPEKLWNSIWISGLVAVFAVILSMFNAFALGIGRVKGRRWIVLLIMLANMLPQEAMLYPLYIMFKQLAYIIIHGPLLLSLRLSKVLLAHICSQACMARSLKQFLRQQLLMVRAAGQFSRILYSQFLSQHCQ